MSTQRQGDLEEAGEPCTRHGSDPVLCTQASTLRLHSELWPFHDFCGHCHTRAPCLLFWEAQHQTQHCRCHLRRDGSPLDRLAGNAKAAQSTTTFFAAGSCSSRCSPQLPGSVLYMKLGRLPLSIPEWDFSNYPKLWQSFTLVLREHHNKSVCATETKLHVEL